VAGACPATARPPRPNWPKAAAALPLAALSTALADAEVRSRALSAVSPILYIAALAFLSCLPMRVFGTDMRREPVSWAGAVTWHALACATLTLDHIVSSVPAGKTTSSQNAGHEPVA
jgi:hypothetical protein